MATKPRRNPNAFFIDSSKLVKLLKRMKKMMGDPGQLTLELTGSGVGIEAAYNEGTLRLIDPSILFEPGETDLRALIPYDVLEKALSGRAEMTIEMLGNGEIGVRATRYNINLKVERAPDPVETTPIDGVASGPLREILTGAASLLQLSDMESGQLLDVHFAWQNGKIISTVADNFHAIYIEGAVQTNGEHRVTMPLKTANHLAEIGGEFLVDANRVGADSDQGRIELQQIPSGETIVPMQAVIDLLSLEPTWRGVINSDELSQSLTNTSAVIDQNGSIVIEPYNERQLRVSAEGRYGEVETLIEVAHLKGTPPKRLEFSNHQSSDVLPKMNGLIVLNHVGNLLRVEPREQGHWKMACFINLISFALFE